MVVPVLVPTAHHSLAAMTNLVPDLPTRPPRKIRPQATSHMHICNTSNRNPVIPYSRHQAMAALHPGPSTGRPHPLGGFVLIHLVRPCPNLVVLDSSFTSGSRASSIGRPTDILTLPITTQHRSMTSPTPANWPHGTTVAPIEQSSNLCGSTSSFLVISCISRYIIHVHR